jgi:prepilin signal peptidase PulO-like enzyme (type II secretory pathway)
MTFILPYIAMIKTVLVSIAPTIPPDAWWLTAFVLCILLLTATVDAFTSVVPDVLIFLGLVTLTATLGLNVSWDNAAQHLRQGLGSCLLIWIINLLWYKKFHHDALGMGDAKWTMLAVACFGFLPALFAWGMGAIIAVCYMLILRIAQYKLTRVTFAPFLFIGLLVGLYWQKFHPLLS